MTLGCQALHYSGHGHRQFLTFEDGKGGLHWISTEELKNLCGAGSSTDGGGSSNGKVEFVFVSACYSRLAGEAFVSAGVGHVVCCSSAPLPAFPATGSGGRLSAARCMHRASGSGLARGRRRGRAVGPPERAGQQHAPWASAPSQTSSLAASGVEKLVVQQGSRAASVRRRRRLLHANFALQLAWAASAVLQSQAASPSRTNASPTVGPPSEEAAAGPSSPRSAQGGAVHGCARPSQRNEAVIESKL